MKEILLSLIKVTEIDNKINQILTDKQDIPNAVKDISNEIGTLQKALKQSLDELETLQTQQKSATEVIIEKTQWALERETRINEIKTTKEFQAASREISLARKEIKDKEDLLKTLNPQLEEATTKFNQLREQTQPKVDELMAKIHEYKARFDSIKATLEQDQANRAVALKEIPSDQAIAYYQKIHQRTIPAISLAANGICTECGTKVLPQVFNQLASSKVLHFCNSCRRILYVEAQLNN